MAAWTTPLTRALNQDFKDELGNLSDAYAMKFRCQVAIVGSFVSVRIEDPLGVVPLALADKIKLRTAELLTHFVKGKRASMEYWMGGCVATWELN